MIFDDDGLTRGMETRRRRTGAKPFELTHGGRGDGIRDGMTLCRFSFLVPFWALSSGFLRVARLSGQS